LEIVKPLKLWVSARQAQAEKYLPGDFSILFNQSSGDNSIIESPYSEIFGEKRF
jgi:hypothetical protein